jgi:hypothetical protein
MTTALQATGGNQVGILTLVTLIALIFLSFPPHFLFSTIPLFKVVQRDRKWGSVGKG